MFIILPMPTAQGTSFRYLSVAVVALSLPALCFSAFAFFAIYAGLYTGLGDLKAVTALLLALALPVLCILGPVQARSHQEGWRSWALLLSPIVVLAGLLSLMRL